MRIQRYVIALSVSLMAVACSTDEQSGPDVAPSDAQADAVPDLDQPVDIAPPDVDIADTAEPTDITVPPICTPGATACASVTSRHICDPTGQAYLAPEPCPAGNRCTLGLCGPACPTNPKFGVYAGCQYWATDLPNYPDPATNPTPENLPWAIVVSNPGDTAVTVGFEMPPLMTWAPADDVVPPGTSVVFELPNINVQGTSQGHFGVYLEATGPVLVHQFNPWDSAFSNDASALLPVPLLGTDHVILSWPTSPFDVVQIPGLPTPPNQNGYFTVIAAYDDTRVTFQTSAPVRNAPNFIGMNAGQLRTVTLQRGEVLSVQGDPGRLVEVADMTGTRVSADKPIAVFGGHEEALIGDPPPPDPFNPENTKSLCCADHLEAQMLPVSLLGTAYFAIKSPPRGSTTVEPDFWRIQAAENGVTITTEPPQAGASGRVLAKKGDFVQIKASASFQVNATGPIQIGQYLVSQGATEDFIGDPSLMVLVPAARFRKDYAFMLPDDGYLKLWASVVRETGQAVTIDGASLQASFTQIAGTGWEYAWFELAPGVHEASSAQRFGLNLYGYGRAVSFSFAAGIAGPRE